jgi:tetratricopeptide (TPR) repeat protein
MALSRSQTSPFCSQAPDLDRERLRYAVSTKALSIWFLFLLLFWSITGATTAVAGQNEANGAPKADRRENANREVRTSGHLLAQARKLLVSAKYEDAVQLLNRAVILDPHNYEAYRWRAVAFAKMSRFKEALADAERAITLDPRHLAGMSTKVGCLNHLGQYEKSIQVANEAAKKLPHARWIYFSRGRALCITRKYAQAIPDLSRVLEEFPNSFEALTPLALAEAGVGDYSAALNNIELISKQARQSLRLTVAPSKTSAQDIELYKTVLQDFERNVSLHGKTVKTLFARALAYFVMEKYAQSVEDCGEVIKLNGKLCQPRILRAYGNLQLKQKKLARDDIEKVITLAPQADTGYIALVHLNFYDGSYLHSIDDLSQKLKSSPDNVAILTARGQVFAELNRHQEALVDLNRVLELNPKRADALVARAEIYQALTRSNDAISDFSTAITLQPHCPVAAYKGRAACYMELHLYKKAIEDLDKLITCSHSSRPLLARAICYEKLGQPDRALTDKRTAESFQTIENIGALQF